MLLLVPVIVFEAEELSISAFDGLGEDEDACGPELSGEPGELVDSEPCFVLDGIDPSELRCGLCVELCCASEGRVLGFPGWRVPESFELPGSLGVPVS